MKDKGPSHLHIFCADFDLAPGDCFVWTRPGIAAVKLLCSVDVDCKLGTIPHKTCIGDVMFDNTTAKDDHAGGFGTNSNCVDPADILDDVNA